MKHSVTDVSLQNIATVNAGLQINEQERSPESPWGHRHMIF